jgi:hypothetical protein
MSGPSFRQECPFPGIQSTWWMFIFALAYLMSATLDSRRFLCFRTNELLSRFEGYSFTNYGKDHSLPSSDTRDLIGTRSAEYRIATANGVFRFDLSALATRGARTNGRPSKFVVYHPGERIAKFKTG